MMSAKTDMYRVSQPALASVWGSVEHFFPMPQVGSLEVAMVGIFIHVN